MVPPAAATTVLALLGMLPPVNETRNDCDAVRRPWIAVWSASPSAPVPQPAADVTATINEANDNQRLDDTLGMSPPRIELSRDRTGTIRAAVQPTTHFSRARGVTWLR